MKIIFKVRQAVIETMGLLFLLISSQIVTFNTIKADEDIYAALRKLTLEELIQVRISVASKAEQSMADSPGIVTTFTAKEIALFGGRDLGEVLSRIPGFEEFPSLLNGRNIVTIRADQAEVNNNHVLFLLNGVPLNRESYTGGIWNEAMLLTIPLETVEQLEVIRGPGSVLYGTNAFAGVVNIVTKSAKQLGSNISVGTGKYGTNIVKLNLSGTNGDWQWTSALRLFETDGWPYQSYDSNGEIFSDDAFSRSPGFIATVANQGFKANLYWGKADQFTVRGSDAASEAAQTDNEKYSINLAYETALNEQWDITSIFSYVAGRTEHNVSSAVPGQQIPLHYETDDFRLELMGHGQLSDNSALLIGGTIDNFTGSTPPPIVLLEDWDTSLYALYAQYELQKDSTKYILGAQYNKAKGSYEKLVPRMGLIHHLSEQNGIKFLYGQAFRTPSTLERLIDASLPTLSLKGDKNLLPEIVTTWDLQYFYAENGHTASITLFRNEQQDLIIRDLIAPGEVVFANKGKLIIEGLELESKYTVDNWYFSGSLTMQQNEDGISEDITIQPHGILKLAMGYSGEEWSIGIFDSYFSAYHDNIIYKPTRQIINPPSDDLHRLSMNISYHPAKLKGWIFETYIDNLLNETSYLPVQKSDPANINTKPAMAGRFIMLTVKKSF